MTFRSEAITVSWFWCASYELIVMKLAMNWPIDLKSANEPAIVLWRGEWRTNGKSPIFDQLTFEPRIVCIFMSSETDCRRRSSRFHGYSLGNRSFMVLWPPVRLAIFRQAATRTGKMKIPWAHKKSRNRQTGKKLKIASDPLMKKTTKKQEMLDVKIEK